MSHTIKTFGWMTTVAGVLLLGQGCQSVSSEQNRGTSSFSRQQTDGSVALLKSKATVWQLNYRRQEGRPYFHPLSLTDGTALTSLRPADHPWHRGLWLSWKYINGINYWDPDLPEGQTEVVDVKTRPGTDYSAQIEMYISYHRVQEPAVLTERRTLAVSAPDRNGCYYIDWLSVFTAGDKNVLLDRTGIPGEKNGKSYGGYAGLSLRMAAYTKGWQFLGSEGPLEPESRGCKARWVDFSGRIANGGFAGVAIFDHPDNPRHPSSWWLSASMPYFSPALLFDKPYTLAAGKTLKLRYRIWVHKGAVDKNLLENNWKAFLTLKNCKQ